jgi:hypothetical protein
MVDDITSDGNLTLNATGYVRVGDSGTPTTASGDDDLYVEGDLEADGTLDVLGVATLRSTLAVQGASVTVGTSSQLHQYQYHQQLRKHQLRQCHDQSEL